MNEKEIRNLRYRFISMAMTSFILVILVVGALINITNYIVAQRDIQWSLDQLIIHQDDIDEYYKEMYSSSENPSFIEVISPSYRNNQFYIFTYDKHGKEVSFYAGKGNNDDRDQIDRRANVILQKEEEQGRDGMYYFRKVTDDKGKTTLVMIDSWNVIFLRIRLRYATIAVGFVSVLAALFLVIYFSNRMIKPEIENIKRQNEFLTNVSHELKTPLAVIRSNAEMEGIINGENEWTESTIRQVDRMSGLINNLVMITKTKEMEDLSEVNVSDVTAGCAKEYSALADSREITISKEIEDDIKITTNESKLRQLVVILLDNAVKYCDEKGNITVSLEKMKKGNKIRLTVSNTYKEGKDMDYSKFFDRFYREDTSHNIDTGGYGIGLSIAKSICDQFEGSIKAEWKDDVISFICELF
ncbi:MAG: HAMP domain-containing histidine kinase [Faecalicoccus sp.]|nr:HAMP domain-containing histidine kinase [Faecalicoccus sp.]